MALRGTFQETEPADLFQILALGGKTGVLTILHQGRAARLVFQNGDVIDAVDGALRGEEAVLCLLAQRAGSFVFTPEVVPPERTIHRTVPALLLTAAQRTDDLARANGLLSKPSARVYVAEALGPEQLAGLGEAEQQLLGLIEGRRSVGEVVVGADMGVSRAYAVLAGLVERGVVAVIAAEEEGSPLLEGFSDTGAAGASGGGAPRAGAARPTAPELREVAEYLRRAVSCPVEGGG